MTGPRCGSCTHFRNDPGYLEEAFKGLTSLSSAHGSVRAEDGICLKHDRYLSPDRSCGDFAARYESPSPPLGGRRI